MVQGDLRHGGKRASSIRVSIGDAGEMSTRAARATAKEYLAQISPGRQPKDDKQAEEPHPVPAIAVGGRVASMYLSPWAHRWPKRDRCGIGSEEVAAVMSIESKA